MSIKDLLYPYTAENIHPGFSIDCVILCYYKKKIRVLLSVYFKDYWQLPGGFMLKHENSEEAARRVLKARTGLDDIYLEQFHLFSDLSRHKKTQNIDIINLHETENKYNSTGVEWFYERYVSLGYYAFVKHDDIGLISTGDDKTKWIDVCNLPTLFLDHNDIINTAMTKIQALMPMLSVAQKLLPDKFKMSDLRRIFEIFSGQTLDRRNFQRKIMASGKLIQLDETANSSPYNPPILYSFNENSGEDDHIRYI